MTYGSGFFKGIEYLDAVVLSSTLSISNQSIGGAVQSQGFNGIDGILGSVNTTIYKHHLSSILNNVAWGLLI